jgi:ABC-type transporter Mla subunit MlaD
MRELLDNFIVDLAWEISDECMERREMQSLLNAMTSRVERLFESLKNAISASTTLAAASKNLISDMDGLNQQLRVLRDLDQHE